MSDQTVAASTHDADAAHLAELGINSEFKREMSLWANFALGFTYLSPVVGIYTVFAYALATAGPPMIWSLLIVGLGQLMVALTFSEVVAQFPVAGGVYPWARRLWGLKYAWLTGWVYLWALLITIAAVAYGSGPYVASLFNLDATPRTSVVFALIVLAIATFINFIGTKALARAAIFGFAAELLGCIVVGGWLLVAHREHGLGVLFDNFGAGEGGYFAAFVAGALIALWMYYGFEACGDVAEEVPNPGRVIPKAMRRTIYVGGAAGGFICLALVLSVTDFAAVISGQDADPVTTTLNAAFGATGAKIVVAVVLISYLSCVLSLQAAASRLAYSYGRDKMIMGSRYLSHFWQRRHIPPVRYCYGGRHPGGHHRLLAGLDRRRHQAHQRGGHRDLPRLPDGGPRRLACAPQGLAADGGVQDGRVGDAGQHHRPYLRRSGHDQHVLAANARCELVRQLHRLGHDLDHRRHRSRLHGARQAIRAWRSAVG